MKKNSKIVLAISFLLYSLNLFSQENNNKFSVGAFIGESTGVLLEKNISPKFALEFNVGIHELFYNYNLEKKYEHLHMSYNNIYSTSLNAKYIHSVNSIENIKVYLLIGPQMRIISGFTYQVNTENYPPGGFYIDDPVTKCEIDFGLNTFVGINYDLYSKISIFGDLGGYFENINNQFWSDFLFRIGIKYNFMKSNDVFSTNK